MSAEGVNSTVSSPLGQVLQFSFAFMARNFFLSLRRVAVPLLVGGCSLYIFLSLYLSQLGAYLQYPVGSIGGRVLGIAASGMLVMLFLHSVVMSCIVEIILGRQISDRKFLGIKVSQRFWDNRAKGFKTAVSDEVADELKELFAAEVTATSELVGRDLNRMWGY